MYQLLINLGPYVQWNLLILLPAWLHTSCMLIAMAVLFIFSFIYSIPIDLPQNLFLLPYVDCHSLLALRGVLYTNIR